MKLLSPSVGFLLMALWMSVAEADISLTLGNKQYLPPPIQQLPVNDNYYNAQENTQLEKKLKENNYANPRYEVVEVHNPHEHSTRGDNDGDNLKLSDAKTKVANNNYTPLQSTSAKEIHIEHINAPSGFSLDDPNLDTSYLSFTTGNDDIIRQNVVENDFKNSIPVSSSSDYNQAFNALQHAFVSAQKYQNQHYGVNNFQIAAYLPPTLQVQDYSAASTPSTGLVYLPPSQINFNNAGGFKGSEYLPPQQYGSSHSLQNSVFKGPDYLPPHQLVIDQPQQNSHQHNSDEHFEQNIPFESPNYLTFHKHDSPQSELKQQKEQQQSSYVTSEHLPQQINMNNVDYSSLLQTNKGTQYLPPGKSKDVVNIKYEGPDYLPPHQQQQQQVTSTQNTEFRGQDYLPPHKQLKENNCDSNKSLKVSRYLPPHPSENKAAFKGPDYLPPTENHEQNQSLPPGYDFQKPSNAEQAIAELHKLPEESQMLVAGLEQSLSTSYGTAKQEELAKEDFNVQGPENQALITNIKSVKDSKYSLPVYHFQKTGNSELAFQTHAADPAINQNSDEINQKHYQAQRHQGTDQHFYSQAQNQQKNKPLSQAFKAPSPNQRVTQSPLPFKGPEYLPPTTESSGYRGPEYLPPTGSQNFKEPDHLIQITEPQAFKGSAYLPPSSGSQPFKGPDYLPPTTRSQNYKSPEYLPPTTRSQNYMGPEYLPPVSVQQSYQAYQQPQFTGPDYLPPTDSTNKQELNPHVIYPLSIYMTNVKANDRYGNRMPFSEYGLPPAKTTIFQTSNDLSPMYRKLASRPHYYAPTMPYYTNEFHSQNFKTKYQNKPALSQQTRQALQHFMPKDARQATITSYYDAPTKLSKVKIRTVQIVNSNANAVKSLKVLESLDHTGVKTLTILGPSDRQPVGDHRVVKVVNGSHEQNVQTLKIFNDHQDVATSTNDATAVGQNKNYLPPRGKRNLNNTTKDQKRRRI